MTTRRFASGIDAGEATSYFGISRRRAPMMPPAAFSISATALLVECSRSSITIGTNGPRLFRGLASVICARSNHFHDRAPRRRYFTALLLMLL